MAIFKKTDAPPRTRERPPAPAKSVSGEAAISIIGPAMRVVGDITTDGTIRVEGEVEGVINAARGVILGQGGVITGDVITGDAVIAGTVDGSIQATNRLELQSTSTVRGEIRTRAEHLTLEAGARFEGKVHMIAEATSESPATLPASTPPPPATVEDGRAPDGRAPTDGLLLPDQVRFVDGPGAVQSVSRE